MESARPRRNVNDDDEELDYSSDEGAAAAHDVGLYSVGGPGGALGAERVVGAVDAGAGRAGGHAVAVGGGGREREREGGTGEGQGDKVFADVDVEGDIV